MSGELRFRLFCLNWSIEDQNEFLKVQWFLFKSYLDGFMNGQFDGYKNDEKMASLDWNWFDQVN